jgi:regulator of PEP synthase PpsR (kinase-PPPase family)
MKKINLHLISDSTGETLGAISRAVMSQFNGVEVEEYMWSLVRTKSRMLKIVEEIKKHEGIVLYTILDQELLDLLLKETNKENIKTISALDGIIAKFSKHIGQDIINKPGRQHALDEEYFEKIDAINFTIDHDDGRKTDSLKDAEIILVGPSRTSKSPTCIYLSYRGYKAANVPFISGVQMPEELFKVTKPLIVGLTINPESLIQVRKNRLKLLNQNVSDNNEYVSIDRVEQEVQEARKMFMKNNWVSIDVSKKSVEETAAAIILKYKEREAKLSQ